MAHQRFGTLQRIATALLFAAAGFWIQAEDQVFLPSRGLMASVGVRQWTAIQGNVNGKRIATLKTAPEIRLADPVTGAGVESILVGGGATDVSAWRSPGLVRLQDELVVAWPFQTAGVQWRIRLYRVGPDAATLNAQVDLNLEGGLQEWVFAITDSHAGIVTWGDLEGTAEISYFPGLAHSGTAPDDLVGRAYLTVPACACEDARLKASVSGVQVFILFSYDAGSGDTSLETVCGGQDMPVPIVTRVRVTTAPDTESTQAGILRWDLVTAPGGQGWVLWDDGASVRWRAADGSGDVLEMPSGGDAGWDWIRQMLAAHATEP